MEPRFAVDSKIITCILPKGRGIIVLKALREQHNIIAATINNARGVGKITPLSYRGIGGSSEKEILSVVAPAEGCDELFGAIYELAEINRPHGGLMYQSALGCATPWTLPDLPEEL